MRRFFDNLFGDALAPDRRLAVFTAHDKRALFLSDSAQAADYARQCSAMHDVYFGVGLVKGAPRGRGRRDDIAAIGALWADIDLAAPFRADKALPGGVDDALLLLRELPLSPSILVHSGYGLHAYWLLHEPFIFTSDRDRDAAARLAKRWHGTICRAAQRHHWALENLGDLTRVLRPPGTRNHKIPGQAVEVRILDATATRRYGCDDFEPYLIDVADQPAIAAGEVVLRHDAEPPIDKLLAAAAESPLFWRTWNRDRNDLADPSQSGYDLSLATLAALRGWDDQEIADLLIAARRRHGEKPEKALRADYVRRTLARARETATSGGVTEVDLSGIVGPTATAAAAPEERDSGPEDPGLIPESLLRVPGFVSEVIDLCLATAPYPNQVMTFCGALALQAFLAGRKVRDPGDNRTNIYLLGLAHSAAGKDWIRKVNTKILHEIGLSHCLGDRLASGEGIQDALMAHPSLFFQTDEFDGMLQSINKSKDARHEGIMSTLLTLYSASNSLFAMRPKAGKPVPGNVDQPNLVLFGTAIPNHYYEALSERMLTNGFFARMIIAESGARGAGQEPGIIQVSDRVLETAQWWARFPPGAGDLRDWHPAPAIVAHTDQARQRLIEARAFVEFEYARAEQRRDAIGMTVWGRVSEHTRKLALLHAISEDHLSPTIDVAAIDWAFGLVLHQTRRMLFMAAQHVADNDFHALCLKLMQKLRESPDHKLPHSMLLKRMKIDAKTFRDLITTLRERGDVEIEPFSTTGRGGVVYGLSEGVKEGVKGR